MKNNRGFTLLELLVVVLIIGILASIALPQYEKAVAKARVASILPTMRRWKDALQAYKLEHGSYCKRGTEEECDEWPDGSDLDARWPADWNNGECGDSNSCSNEYWDMLGCYVGVYGRVVCDHTIAARNHFGISMFQPDEPERENLRNRITCAGHGDKMHKICRGLGGTPLEEGSDAYILY